MNDTELIYICAFRYACGRRTYIVSTVIDFLREKKLSKRTKEIMIKEITERENDEFYNLGDEMDKREWLAFRTHLKEKST